jgi:hypothetical protein
MKTCVGSREHQHFLFIQFIQVFNFESMAASTSSMSSSSSVSSSSTSSSSTSSSTSLSTSSSTTTPSRYTTLSTPLKETYESETHLVSIPTDGITKEYSITYVQIGQNPVSTHFEISISYNKDKNETTFTILSHNRSILWLLERLREADSNNNTILSAAGMDPGVSEKGYGICSFRGNHTRLPYFPHVQVSSVKCEKITYLVYDCED